MNYSVKPEKGDRWFLGDQQYEYLGMSLSDDMEQVIIMVHDPTIEDPPGIYNRTPIYYSRMEQEVV